MATFESFKQELGKLVDTFDERRGRFLNGDRSARISEAQLRLNYLDRFFGALGWDMMNIQNLRPGLQEVIVEPTHIATGQPDYVFRLNGFRRFICEAKRPFDGHIERNYFQTQRYIYVTSSRFGILTDFEHFTLFLVGAAPRSENPWQPLAGWNLHYTQFLYHAGQLWDMLARDNVAAGSLDRLANATPKVQNRNRDDWFVPAEKNQQADAKFLQFMEEQRAALAQDLLAHNPDADWSGPRLTNATQRIMDRLLFQRVCEDRQIDVGRSLSVNYAEWQARHQRPLWHGISRNFRHLKQTFNGGLYGKPADGDGFVDRLLVGDTWLSGFVDQLIGDESPYLFSIIPVDILGSVYERFLASVILPSGKVTRKPEFRKDRGVYYTPAHIVDFIVRRTLDALTSGKTLRQVMRLKVIDIACGSGSFLLAAFDYFCEFYLRWYREHPDDRAADSCYTIGDELRLTANCRRKILLRHIYGVDVDPQAVEVAQMSLFLKVLEGETTQSLTREHQLFPMDTYLPDLGSNIKCGNSIISTDIRTLRISSEQVAAFNPFNWDREFPEIIQRGGFDAVIGNPPYFSVDLVWTSGDTRLQYLRDHYADVYADKSDVLFYFLHKALSIAKSVGFILSRAYLEAYKARKLRSWLASTCSTINIIDFQNQSVFQDAGITTCITLMSRNGDATPATFYRAKQDKEGIAPLDSLLHDRANFDEITVEHGRLSGDSWLFGVATDQLLISKIDGDHPKLGDVLPVRQGVITGENGVFASLPATVVGEWALPQSVWRWRIRTTDIQRWVVQNSNIVQLYPEDASRFSELPQGMKDYLKSNQLALKSRTSILTTVAKLSDEQAKRKYLAKQWWRYWRARDKELFSRPKIWCPFLSPRNRFAFDGSGRYIGDTITTIFDNNQPNDLKYFLSLFNSSVLAWRHKFIGKLKSNNVLEYKPNQLAEWPVPLLDMNNPDQRKLHDDIVTEVTQIIDYTESLATVSENDGTALRRSIGDLEESLDKKVAAIYGLTDEEYAYIKKSVPGEDTEPRRRRQGVEVKWIERRPSDSPPLIVNTRWPDKRIIRRINATARDEFGLKRALIDRKTYTEVNPRFKPEQIEILWSAIRKEVKQRIAWPDGEAPYLIQWSGHDA